jgi:hypothetical protein
MYQNKVTLIGFLGSNPEVRTNNNRSFTTLSLATKSSYKKDDKYISHTEWHRCVVFGKLSEFAKTANKARGIVRAAAYIANINDACVGTDSAGTRYWGWMIPTMEKPLATRTLIAVTTEASRIAFVVVIDSSRTLGCKQVQPVPARLSLSVGSFPVIRSRKNFLHELFKRSRCSVLRRARL